MIAALAIETGIPMSILINEPDELLAEMIDVLVERGEQMKREEARQWLQGRVR